MTRTVRLAGPDDLSDLYALRHDVFVLDQGVPLELERDELDRVAEHAVALEGARVVGTGRLVDGRVGGRGQLVPGSSGSVGTIGRMAVHPAARGTGVGRDLLDLLVQRGRDRGLPAVELHAQVQARGFYERAGFAAFGTVYLEAGIEHVGMRKELSKVAVRRHRTAGGAG